MKRKQTQDKKETKTPKIIKTSSKKNIELLLAESYDGSKHDPTNWFVSEKLDGVRCYWDGVKLQSREGNEFFAPSWFLDHLPKNIKLDGELWMGRGQFQSLVSCVRKKQPIDAEWQKVSYQVFDTICEGPFEIRLGQLHTNVPTNSYIQLVTHTLCLGAHHLDTLLRKTIKEGGEGLMLRQPGSLYEHKRSKTLLKVKQAQDAEGTILEHQESKKKGILGSYLIQLTNGKKCSIGSGLTDEHRKNPLPIGTIITYQFNELTTNGIPRFPRFLRVFMNHNF